MNIKAILESLVELRPHQSHRVGATLGHEQGWNYLQRQAAFDTILWLSSCHSMQRKQRTGKFDREEKGYHLRSRCGSSGCCEGGGGAEKRQCSEVDEMYEPVGE
ncbi:hypothetical protein HZ326_0498 [Fusarium oxysporum f. sp. albedinis]|nr:hypothetical protein HZ326_0498 [Fusarium oxysporum f. sp. albedinis]